MKENKKILYQVLADIFEISFSDINDDMSSDEIESWDSLNTIRMVVEIENIFLVRLEIDDISNIRKVSDICQLLKNNGVDI
jgi:acyl carrier protein